MGRGGGEESSCKECLGEHFEVWKLGILYVVVRYVQCLQKKVIPDHEECMQRMNVVTKGRVSEKDWAVNNENEQDWIDSFYTDS